MICLSEERQGRRFLRPSRLARAPPPSLQNSSPLLAPVLPPPPRRLGAPPPSPTPLPPTPARTTCRRLDDPTPRRGTHTHTRARARARARARSLCSARSPSLRLHCSVVGGQRAPDRVVPLSRSGLCLRAGSDPFSRCSPTIPEAVLVVCISCNLFSIQLPNPIPTMNLVNNNLAPLV
ncbi:hypothetical protein GUJ93_ZPchr0011g28434 [Zizania palustris]|uniref:Uncharacterized protein n=1 Tax=Zizania palustris TaxID=103762 RepID=A0A8J5WJ05_ZIZPA|nr:hypothetical protein GUJ93_ZPchr0011g28434 [Zizania palustris]